MIKAKAVLPSQTELKPEEETIRLAVFWETLKDYPIESVEAAFERAFRELKWFPRPADIIEFIQEYENENYQKESEYLKIEWMEPTEEGREMAKKFLNELMEKLEEKERKADRERVINFEKRREELKKQAKLLVK